MRLGYSGGRSRNHIAGRLADAAVPSSGWLLARCRHVRLRGWGAAAVIQSQGGLPLLPCGRDLQALGRATGRTLLASHAWRRTPYFLSSPPVSAYPIATSLHPLTPTSFAPTAASLPCHPRLQCKPHLPYLLLPERSTASGSTYILLKRSNKLNLATTTLAVSRPRIQTARILPLFPLEAQDVPRRVAVPVHRDHLLRPGGAGAELQEQDEVQPRLHGCGHGAGG